MVFELQVKKDAWSEQKDKRTKPKKKESLSAQQAETDFKKAVQKDGQKVSARLNFLRRLLGSEKKEAIAKAGDNSFVMEELPAKPDNEKTIAEPRRFFLQGDRTDSTAATVKPLENSETIIVPQNFMSAKNPEVNPLATATQREIEDAVDNSHVFQNMEEPEFAEPEFIKLEKGTPKKALEITTGDWETLQTQINKIDDIQYTPEGVPQKIIIAGRQYEILKKLGAGACGAVYLFEMNPAAKKDKGALPEVLAVKDSQVLDYFTEEEKQAKENIAWQEARNLLFMQEQGIDHVPHVFGLSGKNKINTNTGDKGDSYLVAMTFAAGPDLKKVNRDNARSLQNRQSELTSKLTSGEISFAEAQNRLEKLAQEQTENLLNRFAPSIEALSKLQGPESGYVYKDYKPENISAEGILLDHGIAEIVNLKELNDETAYEKKVTAFVDNLTLPTGTLDFMDPLLLIKNYDDLSDTADACISRPENDVASVALAVFRSFCELHGIKQLPPYYVGMPGFEMLEENMYNHIMEALQKTQILPEEFFKALFIGQAPTKADLAEGSQSKQFRSAKVREVRPKVTQLFSSLNTVLRKISLEQIALLKDTIENLWQDFEK